jgi:release factor glutamine methyltransferase
MAVKVGQLVRRGADVLTRAGVPDPLGDARRLMAHAMNVAPDRLLLLEPEPAPFGAEDLFALHVDARARRQPVSQITGARLFWGRAFIVTPDVLDPRPETETLVAEALAGPVSRVLDLGTGSGCLLVTLLAERGGATGQGLDLSPPALAVARANAERHGVAGRAAFALSDWWEAARGPFDLVVSNPPYIAAHEMAALDPEVRDWEPRAALTDEGDGLGAYRAILAGAGAHLAPGGRLLVEVGATQAEAVRALGRAAGLLDEGARADLDGRARVCAFRRA